MPTPYPQSSSAVGTLLRLIEQDKKNAPHAILPTAQPGAAIRESVAAPLESPIAPESPGTARVISMRPEATGVTSPTVAPSVMPARTITGDMGGPVGPQPGASMLPGPSEPTAPMAPAPMAPAPVAPQAPRMATQLTPSVGPGSPMYAEAKRDFDAWLTATKAQIKQEVAKQFTPEARIKKRLGQVASTYDQWKPQPSPSPTPMPQPQQQSKRSLASFLQPIMDFFKRLF